MTSTPPTPEPLLTELLLLPDGSVLADKLTPTLATVLARIGLRPHATTHCRLTGRLSMNEESKHRLGTDPSVILQTSGSSTPAVKSPTPS